MGFLFSMDRKNVSLMKRIFTNGELSLPNPPKQIPDVVADSKVLLTAIGGHIDEGESALDAMNREFQEEAGLSDLSWKQFATLKSENLEINWFKAFSDSIYSIETKEQDMARFYNVEMLHLFDTHPNIKYLVEMALDNNLTNANLIYS